MLKEFKAFAISGNLVDVAIAFVMGGAFGKITSSFIDGMVMPLVSMITQTDFTTWTTTLKEASKAADGKDIPAIVIKYGDFVSAVINFLIVAMVMFMIVKAIAAAKKAAEKEAEAAPAPATPVQEVLLTEIRDLLKSGR